MTLPVLLAYLTFLRKLVIVFTFQKEGWRLPQALYVFYGRVLLAVGSSIINAIHSRLMDRWF